MGGKGRYQTGKVPEGQGRDWKMPPKPPAGAPAVMVKVDFLKNNGGNLRSDLEATAFAEYLVGAGPKGGHSAKGARVVEKGRGESPVAMFASHEKQDADFTRKWMMRDESLGGHDITRWRDKSQAWCVHLMRRVLVASPGKFRISPKEVRQYRIRFCPADGLPADFDYETATRRFMAGVESDHKGRFYWVAGAHFNTDHPHVHVGIRGIDAEGRHLYFTSKYLSHGMQYRARAVLAEMLVEREEAVRAG